jgi:hypothetical protein
MPPQAQSDRAKQPWIQMSEAEPIKEYFVLLSWFVSLQVFITTMEI